MIEIEVKVPLTDENRERLTNGSDFIKEKEIKDVYWDTDVHDLTGKDIWLRERNGEWELKYTKNDGIAVNKRVIDQYEELENESDIRERLGIPPHNSFEEDLRNVGYRPFAPITTTRRTYKRGEFRIDIDSMDFGYSLAEVELLVEHENEKEGAREKILSFIRENSISPEKRGRGKLIEYIYRNLPEKYEALVKTGVIAKD